MAIAISKEAAPAAVSSSLRAPRPATVYEPESRLLSERPWGNADTTPEKSSASAAELAYFILNDGNMSCPEGKQEYIDEFEREIVQVFGRGYVGFYI